MSLLQWPRSYLVTGDEITKSAFTQETPAWPITYLRPPWAWLQAETSPYMRILILSQYCWPEPIPKPLELAQALEAAGSEVTILSGFPNYPSGKLYAGYKLALVRRDEIDSIRVIRTFEYPYHGVRAVGRFVNYLSFMLSAPFGSFFAPKLDVIYVWSPPLTVGVAAWIIARMRRIPFVYDVQDIWPEAAVLSGILKQGVLVKCLSALERFVYHRAGHLLVVTEGARTNLISKGVAPDKVTVMPHWFDDSPFRLHVGLRNGDLREKYGWMGKFVLLFAGNLGLVQGLETVIRAAEILRNDPNLCFVFLGDGADKARLQSLVKVLGLSDQVQFIERKPSARMPEFMAAADALLVHLKDSELSNYVIPSKTLAYLASGKPIIMAMRGAAADLVSEAKAGWIVAPDRPDELAAAVRRIILLPEEERAAVGSQGKAYLAKHLTKDVIIPRYLSLLEKLAKRSS